MNSLIMTFLSLFISVCPPLCGCFYYSIFRGLHTLFYTLFYEEAKKKIEEKDLLEFVSNVSNAILLSSTDEEMLAKTTYLRVEGLFKLKQYKKALSCISEALNVNTGEQIKRLRNYEGVIYGYLGESKKAEWVFQELLTEITDPVFSTEIYLNLIWTYLTVEKDHKNCVEAKKYLDKAQSNFALLPNSLKRKVCNNMSVYYYYQAQYEKAIEILNEAMNYAEEKDLPKLYNNAAEIYLKYNANGDICYSTAIEYLDKSEVIASKYEDKIEMAFSFYIRAMIEVKEEQLFSALDTLYLAFDYYTEAEAYVYSLECLLKINELVSGYKAECMKVMQEKLQSKVEGNPYYKKILTK